MISVRHFLQPSTVTVSRKEDGKLLYVKEEPRCSVPHIITNKITIAALPHASAVVTEGFELN